MRKAYRFRCPECAKVFTYFALGEPMCTGPSESRDEHEPTLMRLIAVGPEAIHPLIAEQRAAGPLILQ